MFFLLCVNLICAASYLYVYVCVWQALLLDSNQIEMISDRAFAGLTHLKRLSLNENRLTMLNGGMLDGVPAITFLDLRSNELQTLTFDNVRPILHNLYNESSYFLLESKFFCMRFFTKRQPTREY